MVDGDDQPKLYDFVMCSSDYSTVVSSNSSKKIPKFKTAPTSNSSRKLVFHNLEFDKDTLKSHDKEKSTTHSNYFPKERDEANDTQSSSLPPSPISSHKTSPNKKAIDAAQVLLELNPK